MIKRIVIAGCRNYNNYEEAEKFIDLCISRIKIDNTLIFLSGCCQGDDILGEKYAIKNGYKIEKFPAERKKYGNSAGPKRNLEMAKVCEYVICFGDGKSKGTKSMLNYAQQYNKPLRIKYIEL